jgi:hypothetical protein
MNLIILTDHNSGKSVAVNIELISYFIEAEDASHTTLYFSSRLYLRVSEGGEVVRSVIANAVKRGN